MAGAENPADGGARAAALSSGSHHRSVLADCRRCCSPHCPSLVPHCPRPPLNSPTATGGGSSINGMGAIRGEAEDYDGWATQGCDGWDWASVLPLFKQLEDDPFTDENPEAHGRGGPIPIYRPPIGNWGAVGKATLETALALGHAFDEDLNRPLTTGASPFPCVLSLTHSKMMIFC